MASTSSKRRRPLAAQEPPELQEALEALRQHNEELADLQVQLEKIVSLDRVCCKILKDLAAEMDLKSEAAERLMQRYETLHERLDALLPGKPTLKQNIKKISSEIQELKHQIEALTEKSYLDYIMAAGSPSHAEKDGLYQVQTAREGSPLFLCSFPASSAQPPFPLTLAHPVFGQFLDDFNDICEPLDDEICKFVEELCYSVLGGKHHISEADMQQAFNGHMSRFLGRKVAIEKIVSTTAKSALGITDATVTCKQEEWAMLGELKAEKSNTLVQGLLTFALYVGVQRQSKQGLFPCLFVEVIGASIRIGALVHLEKVAWQPLTPFLNCFYTEHDRTDMVTLCRAMRALKKGIDRLCRYYDADPTPITTRKDAPYSLWGKQHCSRIGKKLVFIVSLDNGDKRIFKYSRQYGKKVHESWADAGLAPILYGCKTIAGGWLEIEMEYLEGWASAHLLLESMDGDAKAQLQTEISKALDCALAIKIDGCSVAHGDARPPNIMVKELGLGSFDIKFIDFDWAGKVDTTSYPPFMNEELPWAEGVHSGALLKQQHDTWWWHRSG